MLAMPGMINAYAHLAMGLFRGVAEDVPVDAWFNGYIWPMEANLTDEDVYWGALLGLAELIEAGVTCVADHYFAMDQLARAVAEAGLRVNLAWTIFSGAEEQATLMRASQFVAQWHGAADGVSAGATDGALPKLAPPAAYGILKPTEHPAHQ